MAVERHEGRGVEAASRPLGSLVLLIPSVLDGLAIEAGDGEALRTYVKWADPHEGGWRTMRAHIIGWQQRSSCNVRIGGERRREEGGHRLLYATHDWGPGFLERRRF